MGDQENGDRPNTSQPSSQPMDEDTSHAVMPSFYKETMKNDEPKSKGEDVEMKDGAEEGSEENSTAALSETGSDKSSLPTTAGIKKKKRIHWVAEDELVSTFYFE